MTQIDSEKLKETNRNYLDRIEREGLYATYDAVLDTLFLEIGDTAEAFNEHIADNIWLQIAPETLEIVAIEIVDFVSDFLPANRLVRELIGSWEPESNADVRIALTDPDLAPIKGAAESLISSVLAQPSR